MSYQEIIQNSIEHDSCCCYRLKKNWFKCATNTVVSFEKVYIMRVLCMWVLRIRWFSYVCRSIPWWVSNMLRNFFEFEPSTQTVWKRTAKSLHILLDTNTKLIKCFVLCLFNILYNLLCNFFMTIRFQVLLKYHCVISVW